MIKLKTADTFSYFNITYYKTLQLKLKIVLGTYSFPQRKLRLTYVILLLPAGIFLEFN